MRRTLQAAIATLIMIVGLLAANATAQGTYTQSPYLDARVASGDLPAVEDRLPDQPMVFEVLEEIGVYGGTFTVFATGNHPWNDLTEEPARGGFILEMTPDGEVIPGMVLDFEESEDFETFTLHLRPGMQWSNGDPFTSEDFRFKREDMRPFDVAWTQTIFGTPDGFVEIPDEYTVILHLGAAEPSKRLDLVTWKGGEWSSFHPSAYLKQWHPDFNEDAEALATEEGFDTWEDAFNWHREFNPLNDANKPTTQMWMPQTFSTTARLFERNPYFHQVDTAGQQLPYVDQVLSQTVDPETYTLKIVSGETDVAFFTATFADFTLFKENAEAGNYTVYGLPSFMSAAVMYEINFSHPDPVMRELFNALEFRQALSVAIDRDEINDLVFSGLATPLQHTVVRSAPYYRDEWGENAAQFDPDLANQLLDDLGLSERNSDGIRLRSDGDPLTIIIEMSGTVAATSLAINELVVSYWSAMGIDARINVMGQDAGSRIASGNFDLLSDNKDISEMEATLLDESLLALLPRHAWEPWLLANADVEAGAKTLDDFEGGVLPGEEPPEDIMALVQLRRELKGTVWGSEEYLRLATEYWQRFSDNLYTIGTVGEAPFIIIARSNIGNIPDRLPPWIAGKGDMNHFANQWFFKPD